MDQENLENSLKGIRQLLSHLHGEITALESGYSQVLGVLRRLEDKVEIDELSGLMRRGAFFKKWEELLRECQSLQENCGVLLIDIDHFKSINDTHGHPTGDAVIQRVAGLVKQFESPRCFTGRYGGEEFAVAVRGTDAEILGVAEMMRRGVERLHGPVSGGDGRVEWKCTISIGMSSSASLVASGKFGANGKSPYEAGALMQAADDALYAAKRNGRNQVRAA